MREYARTWHLVIAAVVAAATSTGCTPPWRQAYVRGEDAIAVAKYDDAAVAFTESCEIDPQASDACVRAKTLRKRAIESALSTAKAPCERDLGRCLNALKTARRLGVHEKALGKKIAEVLDDASARHVAACVARGSESWATSIAQGRCLTHYEDDVGTVAHQRRVQESLAALANTLEARSDDDDAMRAVRAGFVQCIAPSAEREARLSQTRQAVVNRHGAVFVVADLDGLPSGVGRALCQSPAVTRSPVLCDAGGKQAAGRLPTLQLRGALTTGRVTEYTARTNKSVRYVDHVEERANPEHARLKDRVATLDDENRRARVDVDSATSSCRAAETQLMNASYCYGCAERTQKESACDQKRIAEDALRDAKRALDDAERELRQTDAVLRIEHMAEYPYVETRHTWEQPAHVAAACLEARGAFRAPALDVDRTVSFQDDTHVGFSRAGLAEDPLREPTGAMFSSSAVEIASAELVSYAERCLQAFASDDSRCQDGIDCLQRRSLYVGEDPVVASLQAMASVVDDTFPGLPRLRCRS